MTNWFISYPRSGNTWLRYCIEYLSKRPTAGYPHEIRSIDEPIGSFLDIGVDLNREPILRKRHEFPPLEKDDKAILMLRDPKEAIIRHYKSMPQIQQRQVGIFDEQVRWYADIIGDYDKITFPKMLVYYEDTISKEISVVLKQMCDFLNIPQTHMPELINNIEKHRQNSIGVYTYQFPSLSKGKSAVFHTNGFDPKAIKTINDFLWSNATCVKYINRYK